MYSWCSVAFEEISGEAFFHMKNQVPVPPRVDLALGATRSSWYSCLWSEISAACMCAELCPTLWDPWTRARKAPLSMRFPSKNTRVGYHFLLQEIFSTQRPNPCLLLLLHWQVDFFFLSVSHLGSPWDLSRSLRENPCFPLNSCSFCFTTCTHAWLHIRITWSV